jgi:hypothetical protein
VLAAVLMLAGCAKPWVRPYVWTDERAALAELAARAERIKAVRAACGLTMTDAAGESVTFDGAVNVRVDDEGVWMRLRAWKLSQAAFDLTVRPDGVWIAAPERAEGDMGEVDASQIGAAWSLFMGGFFSSPDAEVVDDGGPTFIVRRAMEKGVRVECTVERATLTPTSYVVLDREGVERQRLTLWMYRELGPGGEPWPMRVRASGPQGSLEVRLEDVELNPMLDQSVFTPPRRAVKRS